MLALALTRSALRKTHTFRAIYKWSRRRIRRLRRLAKLWRDQLLIRRHISGWRILKNKLNWLYKKGCKGINLDSKMSKLMVLRRNHIIIKKNQIYGQIGGMYAKHANYRSLKEASQFHQLLLIRLKIFQEMVLGPCVLNQVNWWKGWMQHGQNQIFRLHKVVPIRIFIIMKKKAG